MTRKATWTNSDGLVVGYGPNSPERTAAGVLHSDTNQKVAKLHVSFESTFGASGAKITIPAGSIVKNVYAKVTTTWAGGTSLTFGDATDADGWIVAGSFGTPSAGGVIQADGAYAYTATEGQLPPKEYATATDLYLTKVGTYTAGEADVYVEYV
jgi:hypothetical protein